MNSEITLDAREFWQVQIDAPIETVWNTIVATDVVMPHLFGALCEAPDGLAKGRTFRMMSRNGKMVTVVAEVLEFSPPHRFSHTIHFTQNTGESPGQTTYELKEKVAAQSLRLSQKPSRDPKRRRWGKAAHLSSPISRASQKPENPRCLGE